MRLLAAARTLAVRTPATRNRYVDLLRALSILVVVLGHWTMAAVTVRDGQLVPGHVLVLAEWTHPLTWVFQVMPVFFLVGGYANALSWRSAQRRGEDYGTWLRARARRLTLPVVPVLLVWLVASAVALSTGVEWRTLRLASTVALVPTWFLAAYVLVVAVAPFTLLAWDRWRWTTVVLGAVAAGLVDWVSLATGSLAFGFVNYLLVWAAVHQLGYAWRDGALAGTTRRAALGALGLAGAVLLVALGPYPLAMVGVDTATVNNTFPTRVTMLFLGLLQAGVVLALEPLGAAWWLTRPVWYLVLAVATGGLVLLLGRFESPEPDPRPAPAWWRPVLAVAGVCAGLAWLALWGVADADGLHVWPFVVPLLALAAGGVLRPPSLARRR